MNIMLRSNSNGFARELRIFRENCTGRKNYQLRLKGTEGKKKKTSESPNSTGLKQAEETTELLAQVPFS